MKILGTDIKNKSILKTSFSKVKGAYLAIAIFSMFINILMLTGPLYMLQIYDRVLLSSSFPTLIALSVLMMFMYIFVGLLEFCRARILSRISSQLEEDLRELTFFKWISASAKNINTGGPAPLQDLTNLSRYVSGPAPGAFFDLPWVPIYIFVIFLLHWWLGVFAIISSIIVVIIALFNENLTRKKFEKSMTISRKEQTLGQQAIHNGDAVYAMGMTNSIYKIWEKLNISKLKIAQSGTDVQGASYAFILSLRAFLQSAILGLGAALAIQQIISAGAMIAASIIFGRAIDPIQRAISHWRGFNEARMTFAKLETFYNRSPPIDKLYNIPIEQGDLIVDRLSAKAPNLSKLVLKNISFNLHTGEQLAVIGPSGSGKSTLARHLVGLTPPFAGSVSINGTKLEHYSNSELGKNIGYLPQIASLFPGTIAQNICRFETDAKIEDVIIAAKTAGLHEFINNLPNGYETNVDNGTNSFSGGEVRRIALAQAFYKFPMLIVLDEPNSNLDAQGDQKLLEALKILRAHNCTVILITHKTEILPAFDTVMVLKDGLQKHYSSLDAFLEFINKNQKKIPIKNT